jgi:hypothetical protein
MEDGSSISELPSPISSGGLTTKSARNFMLADWQLGSGDLRHAVENRE